MKEIAIVGGGVGGLSAAVVCASQGHAVTIFEKEPRLGGYAVSFMREGYAFDVSPRMVPALGSGREFSALFAELGILDRVTITRIEQGVHARLGAYSIRMAPSYAALFSQLAEAFPEEREGLGALFRTLERLGSLYARALDDSLSAWRTIPLFLPCLPGFLRYSYMSTRRFLERYVTNRRLTAILFQPAVFWGIPADELPAVNFIVFYFMAYGYGMYTFPDGGQSVVDALIDRMRVLGVRIETRTAIDAVLVEKRRVVGVRTVDGDTRPCAAVIGNVNAPFLIRDLIGPAHFPASYLRRLDSLSPSLSVLQLHVGLDCPVSEAGVRDHFVIIFPDDDVDACIKRQRASLLPQAFAVESLPACGDNVLGKRQSVLSVVGGVSGARWLALSEAEYAIAKTRASEDMLANLDKVYPGLRGHIRVFDLATPRTFARYSGNPEGAILGYHCVRGSHRDIMKASRPPIKGLYLASGWTKHLGGFLQSMKAGVLAARAASRAT
ncbi:MAG TPA: NAD(P)/FAD-dependent oxidoreductase [Candidatus Hydrogenedentes bacterium]|nr:NAD(P)/FAD-dependent oxidoreductase [Candidatus Hydrogenedentota bacterium]